VIVAATSLVAMVSLLALPATVSGARAHVPTLWVSNTATVGAAPGTSCSNPGYSTIQSAINAASPFGFTVEVCSTGVPYVEQLTITGNVVIKASGGPVTVQLPATPAASTTSCDVTQGSAVSETDQDEISICGATVSITGITVSAYWPADTCYDSLYGIFVGQGGALTTNGLTIDGAGVPLGDPDVGCQGGVGILVGSARGPGQAASAVLKNTTVSGYQKAGIVAQGTGTSLKVTKATVTGRGEVGTAENAIEVDYDARGVISGATLSDNECDPTLIPVCGPNGLENTQASGILFYESAPGSSLKGSTISGNDNGLYYVSDSATEPSSSELAISSDNFNNNADEQIQLDSGKATLSRDTIDGTGAVGIQVLQYDGQPYAPAETASLDTITGQGIGIQVLSDDAGSGDLPGTFAISSSGFAIGNTNATQDNSPGGNFTITGTHDH
jgi:hypothetical protein